MAETALDNLRESPEYTGIPKPTHRFSGMLRTGISLQTPWVNTGMVLGAICIVYGILWDISWHSTIGRDTFWTPAHMLIYLGGTLTGCLGGLLALAGTFWNRETLRGETVGILGARAPLGAWVAIWGAIAMLTSAPFDDWWHDAYGLDVKILSPPHAVLALGMYGCVTGALLLVLAARNRSTHVAQNETSSSRWVVLALGVQLALASILLTELSVPNLQRTQTFYWASAAMYPAFLCAGAQLGVFRWTATWVSLVYMGILLSVIWVLPLFPAEPQLAPVYNRVTHMVPPAFPLLLFAPALAIDAWYGWSRKQSGQLWIPIRVAGAAVLFVLVFMVVQRTFSEFLISPRADNPLFAGSRFFPYSSSPGPWWHEYWQLDRDPVTWRSIWGMLVITLASASLGTGLGLFFRKIRR